MKACKFNVVFHLQNKIKHLAYLNTQEETDTGNCGGWEAILGYRVKVPCKIKKKKVSKQRESIIIPDTRLLLEVIFPFAVHRSPKTVLSWVCRCCEDAVAHSGGNHFKSNHGVAYIK